MGSYWSSQRTTGPTASPSQCRNENGKRPRVADVLLSTEQEELSSSSSSSSLSSSFTAATNQRRPKRQRTEVPPISLFTGMTNKLAVWLAQSFLSFAEYCVPPRDILEEQEFIDSICHVLDCFQSSEPELLTRGWRILCAAATATTTASLLSEEQASDVSYILMGMKVHEQSMRLQLLGCRALRILLQERKTTWQQLVDEGIVAVLLRALRTHPTDLVLQGLMITLLGMLIKETNHDDDSNSCYSLLLEGGAVGIILQAMQVFAEEDRLLYTGCYALHQLGYNAQARVAILDADGALVLEQILQHHLADQELVGICLHALSKLTTVNASELAQFQWNQPNQEENHIVSTILDCMERHPLDQSIQSQSLVCLLRLIGRVWVPPQRSILLILKGISQYHRSSNFLFFACATLREVVDQSSEAMQFLLECGIDGILQAASEHKRAFGLRSILILLLSEILVQQQRTQEENSPVPAAFGGGQQTVAIMGGIEVAIDRIDIDILNDDEEEDEDEE
eukprot:scaffold1514_cov118-Cylindrotheca_fusiformis.AAC.5